MTAPHVTHRLRAAWFVLALVVSLLSPTFADANDVCTPDCPGTPWITPSPQTIDVTLPNGCVIRVTYVHRHACSTWYDIQVTEISLLNTLCNSYTMPQLIQMAAEGVLVQNPMGYPPTSSSDPCKTNYRVTNSNCWKVDPLNSMKITQCPGSGCCLTSYTVCWVNGARQLTQGTTTTANPNCGTDPACQVVCGH